MSNTPRTDKNRVQISNGREFEFYTPIEFSRGLERELNDVYRQFDLYREKSRDEDMELHAEIVSLKAQLAIKQQTINKLLDEGSDVVLRAELAAERERLDWLDRQCPHIYWSANVNHPEQPSGTCAVATGPGACFYRNSYREAIDAAMKEDRS